MIETKTLFEHYTSGENKVATPKQLTRVINRVNRGMAVLDKVEPEWLKKMNLDTLRLESGTFCVIGQIFGDYVSVRAEVATGHSERTGIGRGFVAPGLDAEKDGSWKALDIVWTHAISHRNSGSPRDLLEAPV